MNARKLGPTKINDFTVVAISIWMLGTNDVVFWQLLLSHDPRVNRFLCNGYVTKFWMRANFETGSVNISYIWLTLIVDVFQHDIPCDENEVHAAIMYCTTCCTHLCMECSQLTHSTRTLGRHKLVPISEKPKENPKCSFHPMHLVEFACLEEDCRNAPLMCYICKDYGRHVKHRVRIDRL